MAPYSGTKFLRFFIFTLSLLKCKHSWKTKRFIHSHICKFPWELKKWTANLEPAKAIQVQRIVVEWLTYFWRKLFWFLQQLQEATRKNIIILSFYREGNQGLDKWLGQILKIRCFCHYEAPVICPTSASNLHRWGINTSCPTRQVLKWTHLPWVLTFLDLEILNVATFVSQPVQCWRAEMTKTILHVMVVQHLASYPEVRW